MPWLWQGVGDIEQCVPEQKTPASKGPYGLNMTCKSIVLCSDSEVNDVLVY